MGEEEEEEEQAEEETLSPIISLNALVGIPSFIDYRIMRVSGAVNGKKVHILIDSRITHNFIDEFTVKKFGCQVSSCPTLIVVIVDRNRIKCDQMCAALTWKIQSQQFKIDLLTLSLDG